MTASARSDVEGPRSGIVFDIKRFATDDGPGIRTLVFLKGCPLRCVWCANPESQRAEPEIMYLRLLCAGCGRCIEACPTGAIHIDDVYGLAIDCEACVTCGSCIDACVYGARKLVGRTMTVGDVMSIIRRDRRFYDNSGGGVTISGGEPLSQCGFAREIAQACRVEGIHTAIETCGAVPWDCIESVLPHLDLLFYDVKHIDANRHLELTGATNESILANLSNVIDSFAHGETIVRIPYVPGCNDADSELEAICNHVGRLGRVERIEIMPYHRFGISKYDGLGRDYALRDLSPVNTQDLVRLTTLLSSCGVEVRIDSV